MSKALKDIVQKVNLEGFKVDKYTTRSISLSKRRANGLDYIIELVESGDRVRIGAGVNFEFLNNKNAYHITIGVLRQLPQFSEKFSSSTINNISEVDSIIKDINTSIEILDKYFSTPERTIKSFLSTDFHTAVFNRERGLYNIGLLAFLNGNEKIGRDLFQKFINLNSTHPRNILTSKAIEVFLSKDTFNSGDIKNLIVKEKLEQKKI